MNNKSLYAIRDRVAGEIVGLRMYSVMTFRTDAEAARYFADAINDTTSILNKHPADYELIVCGTMSEGGEITGEPIPRLIITGDALLAVQQPALVKEG